MACSNSPLQRYVVRIQKTQGDLGPAFNALLSGAYVFKQISAVDGLSEGRRKTITLLEQGKEFTLSTDTLVLSELKMQLRLDNDIEGKLVQEMFSSWWDHRDEVLCNIFVDITDRKWCIQHQYIFYGTTIRERPEPGKVLGTPNIGVQDMIFDPYEIERLSAAQILGNALGL